MTACWKRVFLGTGVAFAPGKYVIKGVGEGKKREMGLTEGERMLYNDDRQTTLQ